MKWWPTNPCERVRARASGFLDGRLTAPARAAVQRHLHGCPRCLEELQAMARLSRATHNLPPFRIADGMASRLRRQLALAPTHRPSEQLSRRVLWLAAATLAAGVFSLGYVCGRRTNDANVPAKVVTPPGPAIAAKPQPPRLPDRPQNPLPAPAPATTPNPSLPANARFATMGDEAPRPPQPQRRAVPDAQQLLEALLREMFDDPKD